MELEPSVLNDYSRLPAYQEEQTQTFKRRILNGYRGERRDVINPELGGAGGEICLEQAAVKRPSAGNHPLGRYPTCITSVRRPLPATSCRKDWAQPLPEDPDRGAPAGRLRFGARRDQGGSILPGAARVEEVLLEIGEPTGGTGDSPGE